MKNYHFKYGQSAIDLALDENQVLAELHGNETPPLTNIEEAVAQSLAAPIGLPPLEQWISAGEQVALVVSDLSRFWMRQDLVVPHVVNYLNTRCGVPDADIVIVIANGTHLPAPVADLQTLVTPEIYNRVQVVNHDCLSEQLTYLGTTSRGTVLKIDPLVAARKAICIGACTQHVMAGFGGGRKSILPGVSSIEAINQNHAHALDPLAARSNPRIGNGVLRANPLHEDMCEAAALHPNLFMVNLVMNADMQLAHLFSGHWLKAWEQACAAAERIYQVPITQKADIVIASSGGFPKDMSLYQGSKTIDNVESAIQPGGTLIALMECAEGGGPAEYFDWLLPLEEGRLDQALRENFTIPGYVFYLNCEQASRYKILLLSAIDPASVLPMGIHAFEKLEDLLAQVDFAGKSIYIIPNGSTVIPTLQDSNA